MNKYGAKKTTVGDIEFASRKEARRYTDLLVLQKHGEISDLRLQVVFELVPGVVIKGRRRPPIKYIADFVYTFRGKQVVEDVKGVLTPVYRLKRHLMAAVHGVEINEV